MAELLRWSAGMALPKKKEENQLGGGLPTFSIKNPFQITQAINNQIRANKVNGFNTSNVRSNNFSNNNNFQQSNFQQQNDFQAQQAEQQRRQQEEQERRQRLEQMRQQQEERQRQEQERRAQEQQARQQKQQQLLSSSLGGGNLLNNTSVGDRRAGMPQNSSRGVLGMLSNQNNLDRRLNPVKTESDKNYDKWLSTTSMDDLSKELDKARADNNTDWIRRIQQYSGKSTNDIDIYKKQVGAQNSELNLGRSAATDLRNVNDTKTYDNLDVNDSDNVRFFGRQNLLKKTFKSALGDNANVSGMSYHDVINTYNNASGDQQADIKKAIADEIVDQKKYAKQGNQESLKTISYLADLNALLNQYGNEKGKSFGKQVGDWLSTGGFVGNIGGNALTEALGNITGTEDNTKAYLEKQQNTRDDLGIVGAADAALTGISNTALNLGTGGWYGLANAGVNTANTINSLDDKVLDFDDYGRASLRDKETGEKISELGSTALNDAFAIAGKVGVGPGLGRGSLKDLAKYAWQEPVWAGGTTMIQEGLSNLGKGKDFGDYDWGKVGQSFAANLGQDIGMDLFNLGRGRAQTKIAQQQSDGSLLKGLQEGNLRRQDDGTLAKVNPDGTASRLSDSELAQVIRNESPARRVSQQKSTPAGELSGEPTSSLRALSRPAGSAYENSVSQNSENVNNGITRLADLGYDVSQEVGSKAKKVAKKAADIANEHPLGGTTKLVDIPEVEGSGPERRKVLNFSGLEDPVKDALKSGKKMTTQEFFKANNIESNDLTALKQNYPNEVAAAQKLIKAGVTPETFDSKVFNSDGSRKTAYKGQEIPPMRAIFEMAYNYNKVTDVGSTKDQKRANIFSGDSIKENTMGESSLAKNMSNNEAFSEKTRNKLAGDPVEYKPTTNEERLARANEILSTKSLDEVDSYLRDNYFNTADRNRNSGDTVLAGEFAKMLDADGQYGRATEIINKMSEIATKQGQQIQALSIMSNRSPEGIANMAQTAIQKGGGKVDGELRKQILSNTQDIGKIRAKMAELNTENSDISYKIMNGEGDLPALRKRQMEIGQEYRTCLDQEGRSFAKLSETVNNNSPRDKSIFGSVWRAGLLSGPRTHVGNAVSNTFQNALNAGADRIAAGLDWARTKITGGEREVVSSAGGRGKGLKRGLSAAGEVMKTGTNLWEGTEKVTSGQGANAWGYGGEFEFKNKIADTMVAKPTNYVFRAMSAGDLPFRYSAFENAIRTEAKRQGMNQGYKGQALQDYINSRVATPDPDLQAYGIKKGNESVYDADTFLSRTMSSLDKQINKIDNKVGRNLARTAKTLIAPFVKVPSKVLSTAVDYSPIGSVQAIVKKVGSKKYTTAQFETDLAKSGLGSTAFVGLGYALSSAGLLTGGYPEDQKERDRWKAEGIEPNSIKIGDKYVSMNYLGPMGMLTAMGAGVQQRQSKGEDAFTIATGTITDTLNSFLNQSYVQGLNNALNAVTDSKRYGESFWTSLARGATPNLLRQTAVATDPKQRQVNNIGEAVISGVPGLAQTLNAKVDVYGREIENKQTLPLGQMWDALKISNSRETNDVIDEVSRLHSVDPSNKDLQVTPPQAQSSVSVNGVNVKLTDNQKSQLQKDIGAAALEGMQQVINSSQYQSLSDEEKASALNKARENAQKQVRKQFIEANNITADNNPGTRESGGSAAGDFASKAITSATANTEGKSAITANSSLGQSSKDVLNKYNSMSKEDWNDYLYGSSAESAAAEYNLAKAKYENSLANDELNDAQKIKKEKELRKLNVSKDWEKKYRDAYGLAGSKSDMQEFLNTLDDNERAETVGILNGLNRAMYEAGVIQASTYKSRSNAINGTTTAKSSSGRKKSSGGKSGGSSSGMSSAEASALSSLAKTMVKNNNSNKASTPKAPETKRKMARTKSSSNKTSLNSYSTNLATKATVTKGTKRSIV